MINKKERAEFLEYNKAKRKVFKGEHIDIVYMLIGKTRIKVDGVELTQREKWVLLYLKELAPHLKYAGFIAERGDIDYAYVQRKLATLYNKGLLRRVFGRDNKKYYELTKKGLRIVNLIWNGVEEKVKQRKLF